MDKYITINNCLKYFLEKKDDVHNNIEKIVKHLKFQMMLIQKQGRSATERECVFKDITNALALFSELNHILLQFMETEFSLLKFENIKKTNSVSKYIKNAYVTSTVLSKSYQIKENYIDKYIDTTDEIVNTSYKFHNEEHLSLCNIDDVFVIEKPECNLYKQSSHNTVKSKVNLSNSCDNQMISKSSVRKSFNEGRKKQIENCEPSIKNFMSANISHSVNEFKSNTKQKIDLKKITKNDILKKGTICTFSHVISPSEFYVQIVDDINSQYLDYVTNVVGKIKMQNSKYKTKKDASLILGQYCCAYILSNKMKEWFRAEVIDWKLENKSNDVEVLAVDFGYKYIISYKHLKILDPELRNIPMLAIKCHFALLYPLESTITNKLSIWPETAIEYLRNIANLYCDEPSDNKLFEILFSAVQGDSVAIDLVHYGEEGEDTVGDTFIYMKLAVEISDKNSFEELDFLENNQEGSINNLSELIWGYEPKDDIRVCKFSRLDGTCYKGTNCKKEHIVLKDGYTTDKIPAYSVAKNECLIINRGDTHQILVTAYLDFSTIFIHIVQNPIKNEKLNATINKDLSDLINIMNNKVVKYKEAELNPYIGELVVAYYSNLGLWLRATVIDVNENYKTSNIFKVFAVDFGFEFYCDLTKIKEIKEEFIDLSFQAVKVHLCDYHYSDTHMEEGNVFFQNHIIFKNFLCYFKSSKPPISVKITTFKGADIGPVLLKHGFVMNRIEPLNDVDEKIQPFLDLE